MCVHIVCMRACMCICMYSSSKTCLLRIELIKPATELYRHNLTGTLEASVRATNAQYDDNDILQRLDVRILEVKIIHMELTTLMTFP